MRQQHNGECTGLRTLACGSSNLLWRTICRDGRVWFMAPAQKAGGRKIRGFKSYSLRHIGILRTSLKGSKNKSQGLKSEPVKQKSYIPRYPSRIGATKVKIKSPRCFPVSVHNRHRAEGFRVGASYSIRGNGKDQAWKSAEVRETPNIWV